MIKSKTVSNKANQREYFLDWIKVGIVLLLIPYHTAVSFSHIGHAYVYLEPAVHSWFYIFMSDFLNLWFMRTLFFVSGISVYLGLRKRSPKQFVIERFKRLILPVIFFVLTVGPLSGYILAYTHFNFVGSFFAFYPQFFINLEQYIFWGQMWYCAYLFIFSLVALPLFIFLKKKSHLVEKINHFLIKRSFILLPGILIVLFEAILRPFYPGLQNIIDDWANIAVYLSLFIFGYIMGQSKEIFETMAKKVRLSGIISVICTLLYLYFKRFSSFFTINYGEYIQSVVIAILWGMAAYSLILFILGLAKKYIYKNNALLTYLSKSSFSLYMFHYFIITVLNLFLLKSNLNHYIIWALTTTGTYLVFVILFETVLKRLRFFRFICGIPNR